MLINSLVHVTVLLSDLNRLHHPKDKRFGALYVIAVDRYFPETRKKQLDGVTVRGCGNWGDEWTTKNSMK